MNTMEPTRILRQSRIAGLWYLILGITSPLGLMYIPSRIFVSGDAAATAVNILSQELLVRLGIASIFVGQVAFLIAGLAFYELFKRVDRGQARTLLIFVIASVPISFVSMLGELGAIHILKDAEMLTAFTSAQTNALALTGMTLGTQGIVITGIFWGLWLLPLGILVLKSGWFPKIFGVFLLIGFASYTLDSALAVLFPDQRSFISAPLSIAMALGEIPFLLWLLTRGARVKAINAPQPAA